MKYSSKKFLKVIFLIILFFVCNGVFIKAEEFSLKDGEKLNFSLRWMGIIGGKSTIEAQKESTPNSAESSYLLNATLRTVAFADIVFKIRDEFSSLVILNNKQVIPVWWEVTMKEKNYKYQEKTDFKKILEEEPQIQNPLSALCLLSSRNWEVGDNIVIPILVHKKVCPIKVEAVSKEPLNIYGKIFNTILINVAVEGVELDISSAKIKDFKIWLSDDDKKLPILMKANTSAGLITVILDNREEFFKWKDFGKN